MVERDGSIACQQNSKDHETKKQNYNHQTNNLPVSEETDKNNRKQYPANKILQFEQELRQERNTKQENSKERPLQDEIMTKQKKKKAIIIGDSMIKKIDGYLLTNSIDHRYLVKVRPFLAAKSVDMLDYVKPIKLDLDPEEYVIHIGINDLGKDKTPHEIFSEILRLIKELKTDKNKIVISTIVPRGDPYNTKAEKANTLLKEFCENNSIDTISHDNINVKKHLNKGKLRLNHKDITRFVRTFLKVFETA